MFDGVFVLADWEGKSAVTVGDVFYWINWETGRSVVRNVGETEEKFGECRNVERAF